MAELIGLWQGSGSIFVTEGKQSPPHHLSSGAGTVPFEHLEMTSSGEAAGENGSTCCGTGAGGGMGGT